MVAVAAAVVAADKQRAHPVASVGWCAAGQSIQT